MKKARTRKNADVNLIAKSVLDAATGNTPEPKPDTRNPAAVALGRLGGLKGGKARAESLSKTRRQQIATRAAKARWG